MTVQTLDVKPNSSADGVKVESPPTDELAKAKADNERMKGALSSLQGERDEIKSRLEQLEGLESRRELSAREEAERKKLERKEDNIDDQIYELRKQPEAKPWFTHLEREIEKATKLASHEAIVLLSADFLEETSEELSKTDEYKGLTEQKLLNLIRPFMGQFDTKSPLRKTKLAYKAWQESETHKKEKSESAKKKAEESLSSETSERRARETTAQEIFNKKGDLSVSEKASLREKLGIMHKAK